MVELYKSQSPATSMKDPEARSPSPTSPSPSSIPMRELWGNKGQEVPCIQRAEAEGSPAGISRCLKHPLSLLPVCAKQKVDPFCKPKTHTVIIHQLAQVIATPRTNTPVSNQIIAIDRQPEPPRCPGAGRR